MKSRLTLAAASVIAFATLDSCKAWETHKKAQEIRNRPKDALNIENKTKQRTQHTLEINDFSSKNT